VHNFVQTVIQRDEKSQSSREKQVHLWYCPSSIAVYRKEKTSKRRAAAFANSYISKIISSVKTNSK
jgi:hypothetical protein